MTSAQKKFHKNNPNYKVLTKTPREKYTVKYVTEKLINGVTRHDLEKVESYDRVETLKFEKLLKDNGFCLMHAPEYGWCYVLP